MAEESNREHVESNGDSQVASDQGSVAVEVALKKDLDSKQKFTLHPVLLGVICLFFISTITGEFREANSNEAETFNFARVAGGMIGVLLFFVAPSWAAWRISGRRRNVANITFILMIVLMIVGLGFYGVVGGASSKQALNDLLREKRVLKQKQLELTEKMIAGEDVESELEGVRARQREIDLRVLGLAKGDDGQAIRILAEYKKQIRDRRQLCDSTLNEFFQAGGIEAVGADDELVLGKRLKLLDSCEQALEAMYSDYSNGPGVLRTRLKEAGVADARVSELLQDLRVDLVKNLLGYEQRFIRHSRGLLEFLGDHKGGWKIDERTEEMLFDSNELIEEYNRLVQAIELSIHEETKLRQEMLEIMKQTN